MILNKVDSLTPKWPKDSLIFYLRWNLKVSMTATFYFHFIPCAFLFLHFENTENPVKIFPVANLWGSVSTTYRSTTCVFTPCLIKKDMSLGQRPLLIQEKNSFLENLCIWSSGVIADKWKSFKKTTVKQQTFI